MPVKLAFSRSRSLVVFLLAALLTVFCYYPGLSGPFLFDDDPNITRNTAIHLSSLTSEQVVLAAASFGRGPFKRPLSMASFAFNHLLTGLDPYWFKLTNLVIHIANGLLVFLLCRLWLRALHPQSSASQSDSWMEWVPLAVAAAWMLHPLNLTSVLYVVQRMTSLGALFSLLGMLLYVLGRLRLRAGKPKGFVFIYAGLFGGTLLAFLAKENGALLPLYLFVTEWVLFRFDDPRASVRRRLRLTFLLVLALPLVAAIGVLVLQPSWLLGGYAGRNFSLFERLLTEPRVIVFYLKLLAVPSTRDLSLFHDDIELSNGWLQPWTTLPAVLGLAALLIGAIALRTRQPVFSFGVLFFFAGHALESTLLPLEIAHEHRNYLPIVGVLFAVFFYLFQWPRRVGHVRIGGVFAIVFIALFSAVTLIRSTLWGNLYDLTSSNAANHPMSARWQHELGRALWIASVATEDASIKSDLAGEARERFLSAATLSAQPAGNLIAILHIDTAQGVEPDGEKLASLQDVLSKDPLTPLAVNGFSTWLACLAAGSCKTSAQTVEALLEAVLGNARVSGATRGKLLASAVQWALDQGRPSAAVSYARRAVSSDPRVMQHHLNLIAVLVQVGQTGEAREMLESVKAREDADLYPQKIRVLDESLRKAESLPEATGLDRRSH